jgi:hypothetical protein
MSENNQNSPLDSSKAPRRRFEVIVEEVDDIGHSPATDRSATGANATVAAVVAEGRRRKWWPSCNHLGSYETMTQSTPIPAWQTS